MKFTRFFRKKRSKKRVILEVCVSLFLMTGIGLFVFLRTTQGATIVWDGGGSDGTCGGSAGDGNKWSCGLNWVGDTAPGASDIATFDNTSDKDATIDSGFGGSVAGVDINSGYDGTITQSRSLTVGSSNFDQAAGTWDGTTQTLDINDGGFTVSGGVHTATTGTWTVERSFTSSGGTLTMTGATVTFDGSSTNTDDTTLTCTGSLGGTVNVAKTGSGNNFTLAAGCTIDFQAAISTLGAIINNGTINHNSGSPTLNIDDSDLTNNNGATYNYTGTVITIERNFTQSGTFDLTGITLTFDGNSTNSDDTTLTCTGSLGGTVNVAKTGSGNIFTLAAGCIIEFQAAISTSGGITNNGTINHNSGSPTLNIDDGNLINNNGATYTYTGTAITIEEGFTQNGTMNLSGITVSFDGTSSTHDGTINCTGSLGGSVEFVRTGAGSDTISAGCTVTVTNINMTGSLTNNGTINHTGSTFIMSGTIGLAFTNNAGGVITYAGTAITFEDNFTQNGTWDLTGKTITFSGDSSNENPTVSCSGSLGGSVVIANSTGSTFTLSAGCTITVTDINNTGDITVNGTLNHIGTQFIANSAINNDFTINSGGIVTYSGTAITMETNFTLNSGGVFDLTGKTILVDGDSSNEDQTITCTGELGGTWSLSNTAGAGFVLASGCTITVDSIDNLGETTINGTLNHIGTLFNIDNSGGFGDLIVNSGAVVTFSGTDITVSRDFTQNGTWDLSGKTITFDGISGNGILTCGSTFGGSVVINKGATYTFTIGSNCTIGNFTRTDGAVANPASAYTLTVQGNFSMSTTDTFGGANLTLSMGGGGNQTITQNAGTMSGLFSVNKTAGTASLSTNLTTGSTCNIIEGTFDLNSRTFTCGSTFTVEDGGTLELYGSETTTLPTLNSGSTVKYTGDSDALVDNYTLKDLSYYHLSIASGDSNDTYTPPNSTEDVDGNFALSNGTFTAPSSTLTVGGNFARPGGTFSHNSGSVVLDDVTQTSQISGSTTFNNLTCATAGKNITVISGTTQTVNGAFTITGTGTGLITLVGSSPPTQWDLVSSGTHSVSYARVRDSDATGGDTITTSHSVNLGNNTGWDFTSDQSYENRSKIQGGVNIRGGTKIQSN